MVGTRCNFDHLYLITTSLFLSIFFSPLSPSFFFLYPSLSLSLLLSFNFSPSITRFYFFYSSPSPSSLFLFFLPPVSLINFLPVLLQLFLDPLNLSADHHLVPPSGTGSSSESWSRSFLIPLFLLSLSLSSSPSPFDFLCLRLSLSEIFLSPSICGSSYLIHLKSKEEESKLQIQLDNNKKIHF